jgi:hypothetical protein
VRCSRSPPATRSRSRMARIGWYDNAAAIVNFARLAPQRHARRARWFPTPMARDHRVALSAADTDSPSRGHAPASTARTTTSFRCCSRPASRCGATEPLGQQRFRPGARARLDVMTAHAAWREASPSRS